MKKVLDLKLSVEETLRKWRYRRLDGTETASISAPATSLFTLQLCQFALDNAKDLGTNSDTLTYPDECDAVQGPIRLLARQLIFAAREHPQRTDLISKRAERFQIAVGLPITHKYDFDTAVMAFVMSGASVADVPVPENTPNFACPNCARGVCPLVLFWSHKSGDAAQYLTRLLEPVRV